MTLKERVERAGERVSLKSNAVLSNKKRIFERARKRRFRKKLKKAGGKVETIRFSVVCVEMSSNIE
jgi:N-dimethylarginine dimethylaminohydrolase